MNMTTPATTSAVMPATMRAAVMRQQRIVVDQMAVPEPGPGQVLVKTLARGICGSDLHMLRHGPRLAATADPGDRILQGMDFERDVVMGHEFCAEVLDFGPDCQRRFKPGQKVCSLPVMLGPGWRRTVGYSNDYAGGYGEYMLLQEMLLLPIPDNLTADLAALTEPMAVGLHAVEMARLEPGRRALGDRLRAGWPGGHRGPEDEGIGAGPGGGLFPPAARIGDRHGRRPGDRSGGPLPL